MKTNTLLVVDDDADLGESLREAFEDEGYTVVLARNGREALHLVPELSRPCGIVLDMAMPVMDGPAFYRALKAVPEWADIPVLVSTSDPQRAPRGVPIIAKHAALPQLLAMVAALF
jgi:CheY-like chemotaxis protein